MKKIFFLFMVLLGSLVTGCNMNNSSEGKPVVKNGIISIYTTDPQINDLLENVVIHTQITGDSIVFDIEPSITLPAPINIQIRYGDTEFSYLEDMEKLVIIHDDGTSVNTEPDNLIIDTVKKTISFNVTHFSIFTIQRMKAELYDNIMTLTCLGLKAGAMAFAANLSATFQTGSAELLRMWTKGTAPDGGIEKDDIWQQSELEKLVNNKVFQYLVKQHIDNTKTTGIIPLDRYEDVSFNIDNYSYEFAIGKYYVQYYGTYEKISNSPETFRVDVTLYQEDYCNPEAELSNYLFSFMDRWPSWAQVSIEMDKYGEWYRINSPVYLPPGAKNFYIRSPEYTASFTTEVSSTEFKITTGVYLETTDLNNAIANELGSEYRLADWNDLLAYSGDLVALFDNLGVQNGDTMHISRDGARIWSGNRHYFIARFDHTVPSNFLVHAQLDNDFIDLGSWYNIYRPILAVKN